MPNRGTDHQRLAELAQIAAWSGDGSLVLPVFTDDAAARREFATFLRDLANRIENPDGAWFDPYKCDCGESDPADHPNDCAAWVGEHQ